MAQNENEAGREVVADLLDPDGEFRHKIEGMNEFASSLLAKTLLSADQVADLRISAEKLAGDFADLVDTTIKGSEAFAPLGWALTSISDVTVFRAALDALKSQGPDAAETLLMASWGDWQTQMLVSRIRVAAPDDLQKAIYAARADLVARAWEHHKAGAYEASIPILLAQAEGLTADASNGKMFFSTDDRRQADIVENTSLATVSWSLPEVRLLFSGGDHTTSIAGGLSRHGVMHGRYVGYGTELFSIKCFVLLAAVTEWAREVLRGGEVP